jgi:hypothetical protein
MREERLLKVCAIVAENKNCINRLVRHCLPAGRDDTCMAIFKNKFQAKIQCHPETCPLAGEGPS